MSRDLLRGVPRLTADTRLVEVMCNGGCQFRTRLRLPYILKLVTGFISDEISILESRGNIILVCFRRFRFVALNSLSRVNRS